MNKAFIPYSIADTDAHMVYALGDQLTKQGYEVEYNWDQTNSQRVFDEVAASSFFVGLVTHPRYYKQVVQLWQYAMSQRIPAYLLIEDKMPIANLGKHKEVHVFRRNMPETPVRFIELLFGR
jgi:hypothetical protein